MDTSLTPAAAAKAETTAAPGPAIADDEDWFRPCAIILVTQQSPHLGALVRELVEDDLPCLVVATGAGDSAQLEQLMPLPSVHLLRHGQRDSGAAMAVGLQEAARLGYSHAAQVDAYGRDDLARVSLFLDRASQAPDAVICSHPQLLAAPAGLGAWCLARLSRLSASVRANLCELRVYPLATTLPHVQCRQLAKARHFDSELLLRLHWRNQPMVWLRTTPRAGSDLRSRGSMGMLGILLRAALGGR